MNPRARRYHPWRIAIAVATIALTCAAVIWSVSVARVGGATQAESAPNLTASVVLPSEVTTIAADGRLFWPVALRSKMRTASTAAERCLKANGAVERSADGSVYLDDPDGSAAKACTAEREAVAALWESDEVRQAEIQESRVSHAFERCLGIPAISPSAVAKAVANGRDAAVCADQANAVAMSP